MFSFLNLLLPSFISLFESIRDVWEAIVVYSFMNLILHYCDGENNCLAHITNSPGVMSHIYPLNKCTKPIELNALFLRNCKRATIQFVIIKPIMAVLNVYLFFRATIRTTDENSADETASSESDRLFWFVFTLYNLSYSIALYYLLLFYLATRTHPLLKNKHPLMKFTAVKIIVFATYYQSLIFQLLPGFLTTTEEPASMDTINRSEVGKIWNSFILCCEMLIFALLQTYAFSYREFVTTPTGEAKDSKKEYFDRFEFGDQEEEVEDQSMEAKDIKNRNLREVMNISDITKDAYYNFNIKYKTHVMVDESENLPASTSFGSPNGGKDQDELDHAAENYQGNPFQRLQQNLEMQDLSTQSTSSQQRQALQESQSTTGENKPSSKDLALS